MIYHSKAMSYDYNEEYKGYLRFSIDTLRRQAVQWQRDVEHFDKEAAAAEGLLRKMSVRRKAFYRKGLHALQRIIAAYEEELAEQEKWGLPGLLFEGSPVWDAVRMHSEAAGLLVDFRVKLSALADKERAELAAEAKRRKRGEKLLKECEARKAEKKRKAAALRKATRRRARRSGVAGKGGWR